MKLASAVLLLLLCGCAAHPIHPGTANAFDSGAYDTLSVTDSVIQSTKADLAAGKFPTSIAGNVKSALNALIAAYDTADLAYCGVPVAGTGTGSLQCTASSYHGAAMAGTATATQQATLTASLNQVNAATSQLSAAKAGN